MICFLVKRAHQKILDEGKGIPEDIIKEMKDYIKGDERNEE